MTSDLPPFPPPGVDMQISFAVAVAVRDAPGQVMYCWCSPGEDFLNADLCDQFMSKVVESDSGTATVCAGNAAGEGAWVRVGDLQVNVHAKHAIALGVWLMLHGPGSDRLTAAHRAPERAA